MEDGVSLAKRISTLDNVPSPRSTHHKSQEPATLVGIARIQRSFHFLDTRASGSLLLVSPIFSASLSTLIGVWVSATPRLHYSSVHTQC
ncbi:hypothetical protein P692DRAFT_20426419 [Suillus brevipes Sb2]|nr:hypothetical protein P692DRAFT_20426419 [Suillus brevipes Sb2]